MTDVYIVFLGEYEQRGITGVYSSMERAERDLHPRGGKCHNGHHVEVWTIDEGNTADLNFSERKEGE